MNSVCPHLVPRILIRIVDVVRRWRGVERVERRVRLRANQAAVRMSVLGFQSSNVAVDSVRAIGLSCDGCHLSASLVIGTD